MQVRVQVRARSVFILDRPTNVAESAVALAVAQAQGPAAIAVSGGSDSLALLLLAAAAARAQGKPIAAATVDHGLRPDSAAEADWVAALCARRGIAHTILRWRGAKPESGIPAAARQARYGLLSAWARRLGADRILLGHTLDDQAETVAFRIASHGAAASAAGLRPLSVCPIWPEGRGILLARPLLDARRAALQDFLRAWGQDWIDDPSNSNESFARPRMRARLQALAAAQPDLVPRLAAIGGRLGAAQAAEEADALDMLAAHLRTEVYGAAWLDPAPLRAAPGPVRIAALRLAILALSGEPHAPATAAVRGLWDRLEAKACAASLGGVRIGRLGARFGWRLLLTRDPGAAVGRATPRPDLVLGPGETGVFDGRFEISASPGLTGPVRIRPLGAEAARGVNVPERLKAMLAAAPSHARAALPGIFFPSAHNSATLPDFAGDGTEKKAEVSDETRILARFLGKDRLDAHSASVKGLLTGPV